MQMQIVINASQHGLLSSLLPNAAENPVPPPLKNVRSSIVPLSNIAA